VLRVSVVTVVELYQPPRGYTDSPAWNRESRVYVLAKACIKDGSDETTQGMLGMTASGAISPICSSKKRPFILRHQSLAETTAGEGDSQSIVKY
jgi:hypothetical protein